MSIDIPLWASEDNSPEKKNVSGAAADTVYDFVRLATRWQISAAGSRDILCARNRICSGTGQICAKIFGQFRILPELFLVFQIWTG